MIPTSPGPQESAPVFLPSLRLIRLLAVSAPLWLLSAMIPGGWLVPTAFLALLGLLCWREARTGPGAGNLVLHRRLPPRLSHGEEQQVEIELLNRSGQPLRLVLRDEVPEALDTLEPLAPVSLPGGARALCGYRVRALRRGQHAFGRIIVRQQSGPGLLLRESAFEIPGHVKVYPRFRGVDDYQLLARIDQRDEIVRRPRRVHGAGTDFESLRLYMPGEDLRQVDWKATARRGALISRNRQVERGQQVAVLLDAGRLMAERLDEGTKLDYAMNAAIMLAHVARQRGDAMAVACFSNRIESFLPPVRGVAIVPRVMETLYAVEPRPVESDYWQVTAEMMGRLRRRSLVILLTDVLDAASSAGLRNNLTRAAARHLVLCVVLVDARLREAAEGLPAGPSGSYRKAAACDLLRRRRLALEHLRAGGILVLETEPARLSIQLVRRYLEIRKADLQ
ncbi:MAG TPA: DUF58 domain-containing protein [Verrucomicrobiota bacterium]|nr:DUF58 domain-containing protein [Verrucomicrobiota bacterium]HNU52037.1 DUF58 domain-containing protein [Verrucomicrobiota bacterium]